MRRDGDRRNGFGKGMQAQAGMKQHSTQHSKAQASWLVTICVTFPYKRDEKG